MLRFAASRLRGRARDGSLAAIVVVSLDLAGSIAGPATLCRRPPRSAAWAGKGHVFPARERFARLGFVIRDRRSPGLGGRRGFRTGDPLGGRGGM